MGLVNAEGWKPVFFKKTFPGVKVGSQVPVLRSIPKV